MKRYQNLVFLLFVVLLIALPLAFIKQPAAGPDGEDVEIFAGADLQAKDFVATIAPEYRPWMEPLMAPPSGEVETGLFALQAAIGAGFIGYYFGTRRSKPGSAAKA